MLVRCLALLQVPQYTVFPDISCSLLLVPHTHPWLDQADSTSQALDWAKQSCVTCPLYEFHRREELRNLLRQDYNSHFLQCEEGEGVILVDDTTGQKMGMEW